MTATRILCIGPLDLINGMAAPEQRTPVVLVDVPVEADGAPNTVLLRFTPPWPSRYRIIGADGREAGTGIVSSDQLFDGMRLGSVLADALRAARVGVAGRCSMAPLFVVDRHDPSAHLYSQIRFSRQDALFIRTTEAPVAVDAWPTDPVAFLPEARARHAANPVFLNNHQRYYRKFLFGLELEVKFTLQLPVDIWGLTVLAYDRIATGSLPGYIPEYADEFQQWDYPTRLYEITEPLDARGYISFIPTPDGRYVVKHKRFEADARLRKESISGAQPLPDGTEVHVRGLSLVYRKLPALRRVRYDVNFESLASGHVYGIFFDVVSVVGAPHVAMSQCEVEYLRSRRLLPGDEQEIYDELEDILAWTRALLADAGVEFKEGYYSKLSFLRDNAGPDHFPTDPSQGVLE